MTELATSEEDRRILELISSGEVIGRPLFTTPGVPAERVAALRAAFDATMQDPAFLADAARQSLDVDPLDGARLQQVVERIVTTPAATVAKLVQAIEGRDVVRNVSGGKKAE
jgi:tripartite-type tricarboxylate transporter receptor subunit TctC